MSDRQPHLTQAEFVDLLDGVLHDSRLTHVGGCDQCAAQADALSASSASVRAVEVPEPSPFFWTQLSAKVRERVAREAPAAAPWRWTSRRLVAGTAVFAVAAMAITASLVHTPRHGSSSTTPAVPSSRVVVMPDTLLEDSIDPDADEAWALVRTLADDLDEDEMDLEGVSPVPGTVEHLTLQLNEAERVELARLLQEQLRQRRLPESSS